MSLIGERSSSFVMKMTPNLSKIQLLSIIAGLTLMRMGVLKALMFFQVLVIMFYGVTLYTGKHSKVPEESQDDN